MGGALLSTSGRVSAGVGSAALILASAAIASADDVDFDFERHIAPVIANYCLDCHRPGKTNGGLNLATADGIVKGGESGPAIVPGKPGESYLLERVTAGEMPPKEEDKEPRRRPSQAEISQLKAWIAAGAAWPKDRELGLHEQTVDLEKARRFWSFQPARKPPIPAVQHSDRVANPIDAFIWQKLEAASSEMSPPATPRDWLRRAYLDLTGLPPSIEEQEAFFADTSPEACVHVVDQLLAHPGYGERWARHWLDLVRYADSNGYERDDSKPSVWRYRDYVIDSLNDDKPYDRFVLEQLAGDELPDASVETVIATGFHALGTWNDEVDPLEAAQYRADELDDMIRTTSQTFLGVTIGCARCHNHKFDPFTMVDYYSLAAVLAPLKRPNEGRVDKDRPIGTPEQVAALMARDDKIAAIQKELEPLKKSSAPDNEKIAQLDAEIERLRAETRDLPRAYILYEDSPQAPATHLLLSGRASSLGPVMQPRVPAALTVDQPLFETSNEQTTRRRLSLARWVVDPANPLTARVIVNRVWQHHFGQGLVATPSDFGERGSRPTHPELLDWLAHWFVHDANWSLKELHRLIMTSEVYRASGVGFQPAVDPENKLLSRYPLTRIDVEAIRDSMLAVSGELNTAMHGPAVKLPIAKEVVEAHTDKDQAWKASSAPDIYRRTVYAYVKRTLLVPMLEVLDLCDVSQSTDKRVTTSIAPQALTLYNGEFVNERAAALAERLVRETGSDRDQQIDRAYRLALCRSPTDAELAALRKFLETESAGQQRETPAITAAEANRRALVQMCRVIFNLNEFVYPN